MGDEVFFTREVSISRIIEHHLQATKKSIDAALYRLESPLLARALSLAEINGVNVRLVLDHHKYVVTPVTRNILTGHPVSFRLAAGPKSQFRKMHHKFVILDGQVVLTGSYNWTLESEEQNNENLLLIRQPSVILPYMQEFERLWTASSEA